MITNMWRVLVGNVVLTARLIGTRVTAVRPVAARKPRIRVSGLPRAVVARTDVQGRVTHAFDHWTGRMVAVPRMAAVTSTVTPGGTSLTIVHAARDRYEFAMPVNAMG